jgi:ATP-dependent RNA helicase RhlB
MADSKKNKTKTAQKTVKKSTPKASRQQTKPSNGKEKTAASATAARGTAAARKTNSQAATLSTRAEKKPAPKPSKTSVSRPAAAPKGKPTPAPAKQSSSKSAPRKTAGAKTSREPATKDRALAPTPAPASEKKRPKVQGAVLAEKTAKNPPNQRKPANIVTVVTGFDDNNDEDTGHPLAEMIAVTESESSKVAETIERDGRIVAADFQILDLHEGVKAALRRVKYHKPTEVQALCLPHTLEGKDVAGFAQTGTGKTAVFLITAAHRLLNEQLKSGEKGAPAVLVLVPTRELAAQIEAEAASLYAELKINTMSVFGGSSDIDKQTRALQKKVDVVVATPGRLFDLHRQGAVSFESVGLLVCDEADRMLDMGFIDDVEKVLSMVAENSQKMFFSAPGSEKVHELAFEYLNNPEYIETTPEQITPERITQWCYAARAEEKFLVLLGSIRKENPTCAIVFTNTKVVAEWVGFKLASNGIEAEALTGDIPQNRRMALIKQIKEGQLKVLVATDVLSRGLHVPGLSHVYNFDVPDEAESFIHRIGRTARAGEKGNAITLVCEDYGYNMGAVEDLLGFPVPVRPIESAFLSTEDKSEFPFDSTGRVKSVRDLREPGAKSSSDASPIVFADSDGRGRAPAQQRPERNERPDRAGGERPERTERPERSERPERTERPERNERPERAGSERHGALPPVAAASSASDLRDTRGKERDLRPDYGSRDDKRPAAQSERPQSRYESRPTRESNEARPPREETRAPREETRAPREETRAPRETTEPRSDRSRESKFVRRDERAKEVIEAALLAAARERELLRVSSLRSGLTAEPKLLSGTVAKGAVSKIGQGLVKTLRAAAPGLGNWLKKLGTILDESLDSAAEDEIEADARVARSHSGPVRAMTRDDEPGSRRDSRPRNPRHEREDRKDSARAPESRERATGSDSNSRPERRPHAEDRPSQNKHRSEMSSQGARPQQPEQVQHEGRKQYPSQGQRGPQSEGREPREPRESRGSVTFEGSRYAKPEEDEYLEEPVTEVVFERDGTPLRDDHVDYNDTARNGESNRHRAPGAEDGRHSRHGGGQGRGRESHGRESHGRESHGRESYGGNRSEGGGRSHGSGPRRNFENRKRH